MTRLIRGLMLGRRQATLALRLQAAVWAVAPVRGMPAADVDRAIAALDAWEV